MQWHAAQAIPVQRTVGRLQAPSNGLAAALEQVALPVILLSRSVRVVYASSAAETLLADDDGLRVRDLRLEAADPKGERRLVASCNGSPSPGQKRRGRTPPAR